MLKILALSDSPKITTGFGNVSNQILRGFHDEGWDVTVLGFMDSEPDMEKKLPYTFWPTPPMDEFGYRIMNAVMSKVDPDVVWILIDPGNLNNFVTQLTGLQQMYLRANGTKVQFPVVSYTPIENYPISDNFMQAFSKVKHTKGRVVFYSPLVEQKVLKYNKELEGFTDWAYHGSDHAPFHKMDEDRRNHLRHITGFDKYFIVGSVGTNKRTKGFDTLIYTARILKDMGRNKDIKFYFHTSPDIPTMQGYVLRELAKKYKVEEMILWKPEVDSRPGGNINSINRETDEKIDIMSMERPSKSQDRRVIFSQLGFIDRLNLLDIYVDTSQVEGWGLPPFEAMKCGIPTVSINDYHIRSEIYDEGVYMIEPQPKRLWSTWHTGARLPLIDPLDVANAILKLKDDRSLRDVLSNLGMRRASQFSWDYSRKRMNQVIREVTNG